MEEDQNSENGELTTQDHESTIVDEGNEDTTQEDSHGHEETQQEKNFRALRKKSEQNDRENQELKQRLRTQEEFMKQLMQQQNAPRTQDIPEEADEFAGMDPTEYTNFGQTAKFVDKRLSKLEREIESRAEKKYIEMEQKRESSRFRERLRGKYADFDDVVNSETIAILEEQEPELATTIADLKDPYKMGLQTYNLIKAMNLSSHVQDKKRSKEVTRKLEKNEKTVASPQAHSKRPMAQAYSIGTMDKQEKERVYNEMMGFASKTPGY